MKYGLRPIQMQPARERVASSLRTAIITRRIEPGETLVLETTARELGVSVTPVREAFQILAREGLIELKQNRGAVVIGMTERNLRDHYEMRAVLEGAACAFCCEREADLAEVKGPLDDARVLLAGGGAAGYGELNERFHRAIWDAAGNVKISATLSELWNGLSTGAHTTVEQYAHKSHDEHEEIYAALVRRDGGRANDLMRGHIMRSLDDMLTRYQD